MKGPTKSGEVGSYGGSLKIKICELVTTTP